MKKSVIGLALVLFMLLLPTGVYASSADFSGNGYNPNLSEIGLDYEKFMAMPKSKRTFYADFTPLCTKTDTKYIKVIDSPTNVSPFKSEIQSIEIQSLLRLLSYQKKNSFPRFLGWLENMGSRPLGRTVIMQHMLLLIRIHPQ